MLACQLMMAAMSAVKRFDSHVLHWWAAVRERLAGLSPWSTSGEAEF